LLQSQDICCNHRKFVANRKIFVAIAELVSSIKSGIRGIIWDEKCYRLMEVIIPVM